MLHLDFSLCRSAFLPPLFHSPRNRCATLGSHVPLWRALARLPLQPLGFGRAICAAVLLIFFLAYKEGRATARVFAHLQLSEVFTQPSTSSKLARSPCFELCMARSLVVPLRFGPEISDLALRRIQLLGICCSPYDPQFVPQNCNVQALGTDKLLDPKVVLLRRPPFHFAKKVRHRARFGR